MTNNTDVLINFVLDKSGSMGAVTFPTIEGFNTFIDEQRKQPGEARLSLTLFDTRFETRYVAQDLTEVPALTQSTYVPGGMTALLDAVGTCIKGTEQWLKNNPQFGGRVMTVILTDGAENSSHEWHINQPLVEGDDKDVAGLIQYKQTEGWEFIFLGAGGSAWLEKAFGHVVHADAFFGYTNDALNNSETYAGVAASVSESRTYGSSLRSTSSKHLAGKRLK